MTGVQVSQAYLAPKDLENKTTTNFRIKIHGVVVVSGAGVLMVSLLKVLSTLDGNRIPIQNSLPSTYDSMVYWCLNCAQILVGTILL
jgi:hypothetical protein